MFRLYVCFVPGQNHSPCTHLLMFPRQCRRPNRPVLVKQRLTPASGSATALAIAHVLSRTRRRKRDANDLPRARVAAIQLYAKSQHPKTSPCNQDVNKLSTLHAYHLSDSSLLAKVKITDSSDCFLIQRKCRCSPRLIRPFARREDAGLTSPTNVVPAKERDFNGFP
jgi:hypothetical protein